VVLELGEQDRLSVGEKVSTVGVGDEIERLGGVLREDDLDFRPRTALLAISNWRVASSAMA
jgi:hypothetical protein